MTNPELEGVPPSQAAGGFGRFVLPLFALVLGAGLLLEASGLPIAADYSGLGAGFLVLAVGLILSGIGAVLLVQVLRGAEFGPEDAEGADSGAPVSLRGLALAAAAIGLPTLLMGFLGFPLTAGLAYACVARAFGSRGAVVVDIAIGILVASLVWFSFTKLGVQLGPFLPFGGK